MEEGIGEHRAIRLSGERIVEARIAWPGALSAGLVADAVLVSRPSGSPRGRARFPGGEEALVDRLPASAMEGAPLRLRVTRSAIAERGRAKLAQARPSDAPARPAPTLAETLAEEGHDARILHRFPRCDWDELVAEAFAAEVAFAGGALLICPTPAMVLIDIDGAMDARALALAAVPAIADTLRRLDLAGSIGIDFPSLPAKEDRRAVDNALAEALAGWPHERTAMNGFGLVQLVARRERASLAELAAWRGPAFAARQLLRRAEALQGAGALLLEGHPALETHLTPGFLAELSRRTGRDVRWQARSGLALAAAHAQLVPR